MKFISICSGIEAASVAFAPLGWQAIAFSEIEPFPSALLAHRFPNIPNFGDMQGFRDWPESVFIEADLIVGGPPCQSFSHAGKRKGLKDERGNLTLTYTELIDHADTIRKKHHLPPIIMLYENVPGLLSDKTNAFGCFIGALAGEDMPLEPSGRKWTNSGAVLGPQRAIAWRTVDAQYFGLAQRRKRIFVIASARTGFCPSQVLFEFEGLRRDTPPSRESGQEASSSLGECPEIAISSFTASSFAQYREGVGTLRASGGDLGGGSETLAVDPAPSLAYGIPGNWIGRKPENGGNSTQFMHEIAPAQTATDKHGVVLIDEAHTGSVKAFAQNTRNEVRFIGGDGQISGALAANPGMKQTTYVAITEPTQEKETYPINTQVALRNHKEGDGTGMGIADKESPAYTLQAAHSHAVGIVEPILAFNSRQDPVSGPITGALDRGSPQAQAVVIPSPLSAAFKAGQGASAGSIGYAEELSPTLTSASSGTNRTPALLQADIIAGTQNDAFRDASVNLAPTMRSGSGGGVVQQAFATATSVRRLTPVECERLQGFPDEWTRIPWRNRFICIDNSCEKEFTDKKATLESPPKCPECNQENAEINTPDGHRYKALGNSWAVPVVRWIGQRIEEEIRLAQANE